MSLSSYLHGFLLFSSFVTAAPHTPMLFPRASSSSSCENSATSRSCWGDGFDTSTDYYTDVPETGVTREYWFQLQNGTLAPDGIERQVLTVNGSIPGPTIIADWGDTVIVHVDNALTANGTSIHFHGIRQNYTNQNDGVISITQCPTAPGSSITYKWRATQYGSSWYHSHYALQAWDGILGGIIINGPATANYDIDLGNLVLMDWFHKTPDSLWDAEKKHGPPTADTGLINGTNIYTLDDTTTGSLWNAVFESGKSYRFRLVNGAIDTHFKWTIDGHNFTVIAMDFVPITPYETDIISIGMGQRYDVIVNATEASGNYWLRAIPQISCSTNDNLDGIKGIIRYDASSTADPTTNVTTYTDSCTDESASDLVPYLTLDPGSADLNEALSVGLTSVSSVFYWEVGGTVFDSNTTDPTLLQVLKNVTTFPTDDIAMSIPEADEWTYLVITQPTSNVDHPIHMHGHDFMVLAQASGTYDSDTVSLQTTNPPRRDVAMLPGTGYLVLAWQADNPGAWLAHCHIGWHTDEGLDFQFVERGSEISALVNATELENGCTAWDNWVSENDWTQDFSGV